MCTLKKSGQPLSDNGLTKHKTSDLTVKTKTSNHSFLSGAQLYKRKPVVERQIELIFSLLSNIVQCILKNRIEEFNEVPRRHTLRNSIKPYNMNRLVIILVLMVALAWAQKANYRGYYNLF
jgi:hypothetical protein